ncbi:TIGR01244 family sulfur transferase [Sulfitobacter aestuariivivens]|uniref:TIGR01244 family phosphatase n=1 Tax=Sulfitobacter aestuariivivens TaxID=2766981 RepID=A0A927D1X7_9RHOB|nr:TIGR01244 family sulfur transferase [Sulfitobacter aestuariivivens]MBD3662901.1 TIGR01244 family phosphatase [Sulfitobacter aestuariivivens]
MDIRQLTPTYFVSPQIDPGDMEALKSAGIDCILCNRPDAEVPPSHQADAIEKAATAAGLRFAVCPLTHQTMVPDVIAENRQLGAESGETVLAYCASGTRSTIAWALGQAGRMAPNDILAAARGGGYDIEQIRPMLGEDFAPG